MKVLDLLLCSFLFCAVSMVTGEPQEFPPDAGQSPSDDADCREIAQSTTLNGTMTGDPRVSYYRTGTNSLCYNISPDSVTNLTLKDEFFHCEFAIIPYAAEHCNDSRLSYILPLNTDFSTVTLNEGNIVCSYRVGGKPVPGTLTLVTFEFNGKRPTQVKQHETFDQDECFAIDDKDNGQLCGDVRKVSVSVEGAEEASSNNGGNFVRLFTGDRCESETVFRTVHGNSDFYNQTELDPQIRSFNLVVYVEEEPENLKNEIE